MKFLIINLTDRKIPITRTTMEKEVLIPHKPFLLETIHNPEINFWNNCTDTRFRVISNPTEIERYMQVVRNQDKNNTANTSEVVINENVIKSDAVTTNETNDIDMTETNVTKTSYTEEQLVALKVTELKQLANELNIQLPSGANKATIIECIITNS